MKDGVYSVDVTMTGGSGKASVASPAEVTVKDGNITAKITWSSPNYDYMIVDGVRIEPLTRDPNSVFEISVPSFDKEFKVIADTVAMSQPHEIEYGLTFSSPFKNAK